MRRSAISCLVVLLSALIASLVALGQEDSQTVLAGVPDASQYAGQDLVVLLLETSQRLDPSPPDGGRPEWVVREHVRYWLLTAQGAEDASSLFAPICAVGDVRFLYVRAILPTGEVVAVKGIVPIDTSGTALATRSYYRFRPPRNTLRAGAVLEYEAEVRFDAACGFVAGGIPLLPSSLAVAQCHTVEAPPGQELCWDVIGDVDLRVLRNGSIHEFTVLDVAETSEERGAPCPISPTMSVVFTTATSWSALADAERTMLADRSADDSFIAATANGIVRGLTTREAKIERLCEFVGNSIDYSHHASDWEPYWAATSRDTLMQGMGDCKGKAVLLVSLLRCVGVEAYPALVSASCRSRWLLDLNVLPGPWRIDHVVVAVRGDGELDWQVLDPTCPTCSADGAYTGKTLWILDGAEGSLGTLYTPSWPTLDERTLECSLTATVSNAGRLDARGTLTVPDTLMPGYTPYLNAASSYTDTPQQHWAQILGLDVASPDTTVVVEGRSVHEPVRISFGYSDTTSCHGVCVTRVRECPNVLPIDFPTSSYGSSREEPFETAPIAVTCTATLDIPSASWIQLPHDVHVAAPGVTYDATYMKQGSHVEIVRRFAITTDIVMPEDYDAFAGVVDAALQDPEQAIIWSE